MQGGDTLSSEALIRANIQQV